MDISNQSSNYSLSAQMQMSAKMSYSQKEVQAELDLGGKKVTANMLMQEYTLEFQMKVEVNASGNFKALGSLEDWLKGGDSKKDRVKEILDGLDTEAIGYKGKKLSDLSQEEAQKLVEDDGFFGVQNTAQRLIDFVLNGSGGDEGMLKAGREGIMQGFKEAESLWGGKLPDIAYETINKAMEELDKVFREKGISVLDAQA